MQSIIISAKDKSFIAEQIKKKTAKLHILPANLIKIDPEKSFGIENARKISREMTLKPYGGGDRLIIVYDMEKATTEAGNAILKLLEEPQNNNYIILVTSNINKLLPTIISRWQVISELKTQKVSSQMQKDTVELINKILVSSPGERILLSQKIAKSKEEAIQLLDNLLVYLEEFLYKSDENLRLGKKAVAKMLMNISNARNYLDRYIGFKAVVDILFLGFPKAEK